MTDTIETRRSVIDTCNWLIEKGFVYGTWGNISLRLENGNILITPSRIAYNVMKPEDLVVLAPDRSVISGMRISTSEREIHVGIMNKRPDVNVIIHTHSTYATAASALNTGIPAITEEMCQLIGGGIPVSDRFVMSEHHVELGKVVSNSIGDKSAVLIRNHGPVCCGRNMEEAKVTCQVVEKSAQIYMTLMGAGKFNVLDDQIATEDRNYYLYSYGRS